MRLDREVRNDIEKMIEDRVKHSENVLTLKLSMLIERLDSFNSIMISYIEKQDELNNKINTMNITYNQSLATRAITCPHNESIKTSNEFVNYAKAVKTFKYKSILIISLIVTIITTILNYILPI